jgi:hypothetical protein
MKFLIPVALFAAAVSAQSTACAADYIVETCLGSEQAKVRNQQNQHPLRTLWLTSTPRSVLAQPPTMTAIVPPTKLSLRKTSSYSTRVLDAFFFYCLGSRVCITDMKIANYSCFNNCPNDPRAPSFQNQVTIFCTNASLYGSKAAKATKATTAPVAGAPSPTADATVSAATNSVTPTTSGARNTPTGGAGELALNTGGVLLAVAGVVAAVL